MQCPKTCMKLRLAASQAINNPPHPNSTSQNPSWRSPTAFLRFSHNDRHELRYATKTCSLMFLIVFLIRVRPNGWASRYPKMDTGLRKRKPCIQASNASPANRPLWARLLNFTTQRSAGNAMCNKSLTSLSPSYVFDDSFRKGVPLTAVYH